MARSQKKSVKTEPESTYMWKLAGQILNQLL